MPDQNPNKPGNSQNSAQNKNGSDNKNKQTRRKPAQVKQVGETAPERRVANNRADGQKNQKIEGKQPTQNAAPNQKTGGKQPTQNAAPNQKTGGRQPAQNAAPNQKTEGKQPIQNAAPKQKTQNRNPNGDRKNQAAASGQSAEVVKSTGTRRRGGRKAPDRKPPVRIIPLGGLGEVGKNMTVYECQGDAFIVDCGLTFPDESMLGVDLVIPDFTYIQEIKDRVKGLIITHGHEDHIGGIAFLLKQVRIPIYGTRLTLALLEGKLKEHGLLSKASLTVVKARDVVQMGCMSVEFINVNHSIPDACALAIETPAGVIIQTGDFKVDYTPIRGEVIDLARFGELGSRGVLALLSDSTNAERPGSTSSERTVGVSFDKLFAQAEGKRILIATFASNVHRLQQIIDAAVNYKRKIAVSGRSMENVFAKAMEIGYLEIPNGVLVEIDAIHKHPPEKMVIVTTGSQGEPMSALTRMSTGDHRKVNVTARDCIIISANPIPGNEKLVTRVINELLKLGAQVVYEKMFEIHVSGHACQDELKMMMALTKPKFFIPLHGEYKHLRKHADLALSMGIDSKNVMISDIGQIIELDNESVKIAGTVPAGKVLVDGLGVGDVGSIVLRDRKHLAEDGLIVVVTTIERETGQIISGPDIVSRGFVYVRESEDMIGQAREIARQSIQKCIDNNTREWGVFKQRVRDDISDYLWHVTKRNPMILPVIQEI